MSSRIAQLYKRLKLTDSKDFYTIEPDFFLCLSSDSDRASLPCVNAFLTVSAWFGTSERSGVWTFYESANPPDVQKAADYLRAAGETALAAVLESGMHDYQNPVYAEEFSYPEEWMIEAAEIDRWIQKHAAQLQDLLYRLLLEHEDCILNLRNADNSGGIK